MSVSSDIQRQENMYKAKFIRHYTGQLSVAPQKAVRYSVNTGYPIRDSSLFFSHVSVAFGNFFKRIKG